MLFCAPDTRWSLYGVGWNRSILERIGAWIWSNYWTKCEHVTADGDLLVHLEQLLGDADELVVEAELQAFTTEQHVVTSTVHETNCETANKLNAVQQSLNVEQSYEPFLTPFLSDITLEGLRVTISSTKDDLFIIFADILSTLIERKKVFVLTV